MMKIAGALVVGSGVAMASAIYLGIPYWGLDLGNGSTQEKTAAPESAVITLPGFPILARANGSAKEWYIPARIRLVIKDKKLKHKVCAWTPKIHEVLSLYFNRHPAFPAVHEMRFASAKTEEHLKSSILKMTGGHWLDSLKLEYGKLEQATVDQKTLCLQRYT